MLRRKQEGSSARSSANATPGFGAASPSQPQHNTKRNLPVGSDKDEGKIHRRSGRPLAASTGGRAVTSSSYWIVRLIGLGILCLFAVGISRGKKQHPRATAGFGGDGRSSASSAATQGQAVRRQPPSRSTGGGGGGVRAAAALDGHDHHDGPPPQPQRLPPEPHSDAEDPRSGSHHMRTTGEAMAAMRAQPSTFVDGERKLKKELMKLKERQAKGLDKGVKVLTMWLGDDIPVWVSKENEAEWSEKVKKRTAELQAKEDAFWARMTEKIRSGEGIEKSSNVKTTVGADEAAKTIKAKNVLGDSYDDENKNKGKANGDDDADKGKISDEESPDEMFTSNENGEDSKDEGEKISLEKKNVRDGGANAHTYPSPAAMVGDNAVVLLEPTFGQHRPDEDAVFAFAEGYDIKIYLAFVESLKASGFKGDVVLSVSSLKNLKPGVEDYLRAQPNMVVYTVDWKCITGSGKIDPDPKEGMRMCQFSGMYGTPDSDSPDSKPAPAADAREARPVATARYELYWAWSLKYHANSWLMLIDSRDALFQTDPFQGLPRQDDEQAAEGTLYFFEENSDATRIGKSQFNSRWLKRAYGEENVKPFFDKPVICSGSSMGEQVAIEAYLRAMVSQFDKTHCKTKGCDQGFHNYLYYSNGLDGVEGIKSTEMHSQGKGIINNLGLLRDKPLRERGLLKEGTNEVLNWDGSISPVAHQFDRDKELTRIVNKYKADWLAKWKGS